MNTGTIYFMQQSNKMYKIGFTTNLPKRLKELQTGNPDNLRIKYIIPDSTLSFESYLHGICSRYCVDKEWFKEEVLEFLLKRSSPWFKQNILRYAEGSQIGTTKEP